MEALERGVLLVLLEIVGARIDRRREIGEARGDRLDVAVGHPGREIVRLGLLQIASLDRLGERTRLLDELGRLQGQIELVLREWPDERASTAGASPRLPTRRTR